MSKKDDVNVYYSQSELHNIFPKLRDKDSNQFEWIKKNKIYYMIPNQVRSSILVWNHQVPGLSHHICTSLHYT